MFGQGYLKPVFASQPSSYLPVWWDVQISLEAGNIHQKRVGGRISLPMSKLISKKRWEHWWETRDGQ